MGSSSVEGSARRVIRSRQRNAKGDDAAAPVFERVVVDVEGVFGHSPERTDGGQRPAMVAVQLVDVFTDHDQLALLAARQVEVVHQALARNPLHRCTGACIAPSAARRCLILPEAAAWAC